MQFIRCQCPSCSVPLRIKDESFVGTRIDCPECHTPIVIVNVTGQGVCAVLASDREKQADASDTPHRPELVRRQLSTSSAGVFTTASFAYLAKVGGSLRQQAAPWIDRLLTPVGVAWTVTAACAVAMLVAVGPFNSDDRARNDSRDPIGTVEEPQPAAEQPPPAAGEHPRSDATAAAAAKPESEMPAARRNLETVGTWFAGYYDVHQQFPSPPIRPDGVPPEQRLSWLAVLVSESEGHEAIGPLWDRTWQDPLNDRFVRRRFREFLNPAIKPMVSPDGYPATHYVGVAGVGDDAATLSLGHPRAGVFGHDRQTRRDDIRDGASDTIMIAGVQDHIGAWAAGGSATIRPLTREPYVNGPDGFGTGNPDGMWVLLADGSVRFQSAKTHPTILRRLAAMADGLPLDVKVPGNPGDAPARSPSPTVVVADAAPRRSESDRGPVPDVRAGSRAAHDGPAPDPQAGKSPQSPSDTATHAKPVSDANPTVVQIPAEPPAPVDVDAALAQRILLFDQSRPAPFVQVLMQIEEMAGVPIRFEDPSVGAALVNEPVTLKLEQTTIAAILRTLLAPLELTYEVRDSQVRIRTSRPESGDRKSPM